MSLSPAESASLRLSSDFVVGWKRCPDRSWGTPIGTPNRLRWGLHRLLAVFVWPRQRYAQCIAVSRVPQACLERRPRWGVGALLSSVTSRTRACTGHGLGAGVGDAPVEGLFLIGIATDPSESPSAVRSPLVRQLLTAHECQDRRTRAASLRHGPAAHARNPGTASRQGCRASLCRHSDSAAEPLHRCHPSRQRMSEVDERVGDCDA